MAGEIGNNFAVKLKTDELKKMAYEQYCAHIANGNSKKSWYFEHPTTSLTWETMEKYIRESEHDFDPLKNKIAECKSLGYWESVVQDSAKGKNKDANTATLQMLMRNKFGWDRVDTRHDESTSTVEHNHEKLLNQLAEAQKAFSPQ